MPVVEQDPPARRRLPFVVAHDGSLARHASGYGVFQSQVPKSRHPEEGVLGHLAEPASVLPRRKGGQRLGVANHGRGLPKCPNQVLPFPEVDARLAAYGRVDLAEQGGRHVYHRDPAVVHGGGEAGDVGDQSPADGNHDVASMQPPPGKSAAQLLDRLEVLGLFAVIDVIAALFDSTVHAPRDRFLGHHDGSGGADRYQLAQVVPGAGADQHWIGPVAEIHYDLMHM